MDKRTYLYLGLGLLGAVAIFAGGYLAASTATPEVIYEDSLSEVDPVDILDEPSAIISDVMYEISQSEIDGLVQMREEEKLAHDVYTTLYQTWGLKIFTNISDSEQTHTDLVAELLEKYDIDDPALFAVGDFDSSDMQDLYDSLVEKGKESIEDAIEVGAIIEDLDIMDLEVLLEDTQNEDIIAVYGNLLRGSRNHMRSFTSTLSRYGESYTPIYITEEAYLDIISSGQERGTETH